MSVAVAYRSLHPERTTAAIQANRAARTAALDAMNAFTDALFTPGEWTMTGSFNFDGSIHPTGFTRREGFVNANDAIPGLRFDAKSRHLVPARRTEEGKSLVRELAALAYVPSFIDGLGGVVYATDGDRAYFTGWTFHLLAEQVFATLSVPTIDERAQTAALAELWTPAPLSVFHAAVEASA